MSFATPSVRFINLPTITLPNGILRFISVTENQHTVVTDGDMLMGTPLFLATDILTGTSVTADNQPRIHARYGKQGLATKLTLPSGTIKINGLHGTSRGLWFYSIVGALKVTFEFHSPDQQVALMDALQDVWRTKYKDPPLPSSIVVQHVEENRGKNRDRDVDGETSLEARSCLPIDHETRNKGHVDATGISDEKNIESGKPIKRHYTISISNTVSKRKRTLDEFVNEPVLKIDRSTSTVDQVVQGDGVIDLEVHHVEEVLTEREPPPSSPDQAKCWCGAVQRRLQELAERYGDDILSEELTCSMEHVVEMLHVMTRGEIDTCLQLLNSLSDVVCENTRRDREEALRQSSDRVSEVLAEWLGSKFNREISQISERVVEFKQRNIDQINNLPQAKNLVNTLFPKPMVDFIMTWLGTRTEQRMASSELGVSLASDLNHGDESHRTGHDDHVGNRPTVGKKRTEEGNSCYPLAQFILELANQTLISGMAHVIYPRLIQNTNV